MKGEINHKKGEKYITFKCPVFVKEKGVCEKAAAQEQVIISLGIQT